MTRRRQPLFLILGFVVAFVAYVILRVRTFDLISAIGLAIALLLFYMFSAIGGAIVLLVIPRFVAFHNKFKRLFEDSMRVEEAESPVWPQVAIGILLNLAYFTVMYFVPFPTIAASIPFGKLIENVLPSSFDVFISTYFPTSQILFFIFCGSAGPATVYMIRYLRYTRHEHELGGTTITVLQTFCYLSWVALAMYFGARVGFDQSRAELFFYDFLVFVLPGTIANLAIIRFVGVRRALGYIR